MGGPLSYFTENLSHWLEWTCGFTFFQFSSKVNKSNSCCAVTKFPSGRTHKSNFWLHKQLHEEQAPTAGLIQKGVGLRLGLSSRLVKQATSSRALVVEEDTVACIDTIRLPVINHNPVCIQLGSTCRKGKYLRLFTHTNSSIVSFYRRVSGGKTVLSLSEGFLGLCQTVHWLRPATRKRGESILTKPDSFSLSMHHFVHRALLVCNACHWNKHKNLQYGILSCLFLVTENQNVDHN